MNASLSITQHLGSRTCAPVYSSATRTHPFLISAANGTLTSSTLSFWLAQDRIYAAHAYPRFIGSLISRIPLGQNTLPSAVSQRILDVLVYALQNVLREVAFFDEVAKKWGLDLDRKERKGTRDYTAEMARVSGTGIIEEGLLFLWAMEKVSWLRSTHITKMGAVLIGARCQVYLDAWSNVHEKLLSNASAGRASDEALLSLADNWSSPEFRRFVDDLAQVVDEVYRVLGNDTWEAAEYIWDRVIELEEGFWPKEEEEERGA
ncbi:Bifunctional TENA2 protein [Hypsizygus marmoreus]|uniref:Bifunctional TENA2 protein n=1 Tax=Hypsizygus marmoreus TaxID=39966 RepID=A0A369KDP3_HYPMA|nr:Bifunctional TENA2 protein [Hypsizygus marmoreus]